MKIRFHGFRIYAGGGLPLADFGKVLVASSSGDKEYMFNDHNRLFLFEGESDPEFYTGLLITAKDQRTFPQLLKESGKLSIKVSELAKGSRLMDFNFFVINKTTFCGLYQHYHASCSLAQFGVFLRQAFYKPEQEVRKFAKIKELLASGGFSRESAEARAERIFKKRMAFDLFFKEDDFLKIIKTMNEIKQFQFDVSTKVAKQRTFTPDLELKRVQEQIAFANPSLVKKIASAIGDFVKEKNISRGKVVTVDPTGEIYPVYLKRNIDGFGEFDFDEVTSEIELDVLEDFAECPVITNLIAAGKANKALFCDPDDED